MPIGIELLGPAWSEGKLIGLAYSFEQATKIRIPPKSTPRLAWVLSTQRITTRFIGGALPRPAVLFAVVDVRALR